MALANFTTKEIILSEHDIFMIENYGGLCLATSKDILLNSKINFEDIERMNGTFKKYAWGSEDFIKYRKKSVNKAIKNFATNTLNYITL